MYKDLSLKEKAKVIREGVRLGLTSIDDILSLYDDAISHKFAEGSIATPDWDPNNPYHYHTASGEKVVITPEDWEKHKGLPYFKLVEDAVLTEQAAHPGPEYIINPKFSEDLRMVYKGNMGPKYLNYSSFYGNLPQGYSFTPEGLVLDKQGNLYVLKGFRQTPRFTYDENNPLVFPVLESRNQGNVTFYPVNMEKTLKKPLKVDKSIDFKPLKINYINSAFVSYLHPELATSDYLPEHKRAIKQALKLGYRVLDNYREGLFNGYLIGFTDLELNNFKTELWNKLESNNLLYDTSGNPSKDGYLWFDGDYYNKTDWFKPETLTPKDRITGGSRSSWNSGVWSDGPNGNQGFLTRYEMRPILKPYIEVGPLQVNDVLTYAQGGSIVTPYGQWKYPGKDTIIPSNNITMDNVNYPVLGVSDTGDIKIMMPWNDYKFRGSVVYEHPLIGNLALEGKKFNRQRISDDDYFSIMEKVALENNAKWNKDRKKRNQRLLSIDEELVRLLNSNDYDYRGYYTKYPNSKANADTHWTDEFKTVYHPTFSEESRYSGVIDRNYNPYGYIGGSWGNNDEFIPAPWLAGNQYLLGGGYNKYSIFDKWREWVTKKLEEYNLMPIVNDVPIALPEVVIQNTKLGPISDYDNNTSELKYDYNTNTYDVNPIPKGLLKDAYTYMAELAPAMVAAGVPSIAYNTAMKVALSGVAGALAKQVIASETGGKGVDLASRAITGKSFGKNVENASNGVIPELFGLYLNPGYFVNGLSVVDGVVRNVTKRNINTPIKEVVENVKPFELDMTLGYHPENVPGSITELSYFGMTPKEAYIQANEDLGKIGIGGKFMLDYNGAMSSDSYPMMLNMMRREKTPNFNITQSMLNGSPKMMRLNDFGRVDSDFGLMRKLNPNSEKMKELSGMMWKNVDRINKKIDAFNVSRNMNIPHAYVPENDFMNGIYVPALLAERLYKQGSSIYIKPEKYILQGKKYFLGGKIIEGEFDVENISKEEINELNKLGFEIEVL